VEVDEVVEGGGYRILEGGEEGGRLFYFLTCPELSRFSNSLSL
jgi:hypothetical protein